MPKEANITGLCQCGCGRVPWIATINAPSKGWVKGRPVHFVKGHWNKQESAHNWRGDAATTQTKNKRAVRWFDITGKACDDCGAKAKDRHHKDGDPGNNAQENIAFLCHRCHMIRHWNMGTRVLPKTQLVPLRPCVVCGELAKPLRRGRCHKCNEYLRRNGTERPMVIEPIRECSQGHAYTPENTYTASNGSRHCKTCHCENERKRRARKVIPSKERGE